MMSAPLRQRNLMKNLSLHYSKCSRKKRYKLPRKRKRNITLRRKRRRKNAKRAVTKVQSDTEETLRATPIPLTRARKKALLLKMKDKNRNQKRRKSRSTKGRTVLTRPQILRIRDEKLTSGDTLKTILNAVILTHERRIKLRRRNIVTKRQRNITRNVNNILCFGQDFIDSEWHYR